MILIMIWQAKQFVVPFRFCMFSCSHFQVKRIFSNFTVKERPHSVGSVSFLSNYGGKNKNTLFRGPEAALFDFGVTKKMWWINKKHFHMIFPYLWDQIHELPSCLIIISAFPQRFFYITAVSFLCSLSDFEIKDFALASSASVFSKTGPIAGIYKKWIFAEIHNEFTLLQMMCGTQPIIKASPFFTYRRPTN